MMISNEALLAKWNNLPHFYQSFVLADSTHPLDLYIGYEEIGEKTLLLVCAFEPVDLPSSKSIICRMRQRQDNLWTISLSLVRAEQEAVFIHLCNDLIESSRKQANDFAGVDFFVRRYKQWHRLLEYQSKGLMDEGKRRGLIGELSFIEDAVALGKSISLIIEAWVGPDGADQDFIFSDLWYEVKAIGSASKTISISSLEQLNAGTPGELVAVLIDKTTSGDPNGFTLMEKIAEIRLLVQSDSSLRDKFEAKLLRYGYIDLPDYNEQHYRVGGIEKYSVNESFPKLTRKNVLAEIASVEYTISRNAVAPWRIIGVGGRYGHIGI